MHWKKEHVEIIQEMQRLKWTPKEIANYFEVSPDAVSRILEKHKHGFFRRFATKVGDGKRYQT